MSGRTRSSTRSARGPHCGWPAPPAGDRGGPPPDECWGDVVVAAAEEVAPSAGDDVDPDERSGTFWFMTDISVWVIAIDPRRSSGTTPTRSIGTLTSLVTHPEDLAEVPPMAYELYNGSATLPATPSGWRRATGAGCRWPSSCAA